MDGTINKAIAGGLVTLVVAWLANYGWTLSPIMNDALNSLMFALVTYVAGHMIVFLSPANKSKV